MNKINWKRKKNKIKNILFFILFFFLFFIYSIFLFTDKEESFSYKNKDGFLRDVFETKNKRIEKLKKESFLKKVQQLEKEECLVISWLNGKERCNLKNNQAEKCLNETNFYFKPYCYQYKIYHQKKPEKVKALYYSAYGASNDRKINYLISLSKKTEINSLVIDIKETNGEIYLKFNNWEYENIKPKIDNIIKNPKELIEKLHQNNIYVIGRIVLFKDKFLASKRPDLAVKKLDKKNVWLDYAGNKWVDPASKEVWDYNLEIARQAYLLGFDEINIDYVRFPTDGPLNNIYYPFSNDYILSDKKWGIAKVLDEFYYYFTKNLKDEFSEIKISIDLFGQTTIDDRDFGIGQILSSALLYFDAVSPMSYPSHYSWNFVPFSDGPDNHPYEVIFKSYQKASQKIDRLNLTISNAKLKKEKILLRPNFQASLNLDEVEKINEIKKEKIRPWYQAFTCTWCRFYKPYGRNEVQEQIRAGKESGFASWMLWNASSRYSEKLFNKIN